LLAGSFKKINPNYQLPTVRGAEGANSCDDDYYCPASDDEAEERDTTELEDTLSDDQLLLASPILYGFSLSDKLWRACCSPLITHLNVLTKLLICSRVQR